MHNYVEDLCRTFCADIFVRICVDKFDENFVELFLALYFGMQICARMLD